MLYHPWIWLNELQHSGAVSAVSAPIALAFTVITVIYALKAYNGSLEQLKLARVPANAAQRPFVLVEDRQINPGA